MTLTAPISTDLQHDDIEVIDDLQITNDSVQAHSGEAQATTPILREPLVPFLILGIISWVAIIVTASLLAF